MKINRSCIKIFSLTLPECLFTVETWNFYFLLLPRDNPFQDASCEAGAIKNKIKEYKRTFENFSEIEFIVFLFLFRVGFRELKKRSRLGLMRISLIRIYAFDLQATRIFAMFSVKRYIYVSRFSVSYISVRHHWILKKPYLLVIVKTSRFTHDMWYVIYENIPLYSSIINICEVEICGAVEIFAR